MSSVKTTDNMEAIGRDELNRLAIGELSEIHLLGTGGPDLVVKLSKVDKDVLERASTGKEIVALSAQGKHSSQVLFKGYGTGTNIFSVEPKAR